VFRTCNPSFELPSFDASFANPSRCFRSSVIVVRAEDVAIPPPDLAAHFRREEDEEIEETFAEERLNPIKSSKRRERHAEKTMRKSRC